MAEKRESCSHKEKSVMSTSIPVLNRNNTLPPLLLPDLRLIDYHQKMTSARVTPSKFNNDEITSDPFLAGSGVPSLKRSLDRNVRVNVNVNNLESLAYIATKRPKLMTKIGPIRAPNSVVSRLNLITPPPTAPVSTTISPSPSFLTLRSPSDDNKSSSASSVSPQPIKLENKKSLGSNAKRQRIGPSCDGCRLKKIKCDARIEILLQDESIVPLVSDKLHHIFTKEETLENLDTMFKNVDMPKELYEENTSDEDGDAWEKTPTLIKHIDKIIMFKPCTSCRKRRSSQGNHNQDEECTNNRNAGCIFSKGFTRADINVFSKISSRVTSKSMYDMDILDYRNAGF